MGPFSHIIGFDWDKGNLDKNWEKQGVSNAECEEVYFNAPLVVRPDPAHSGDEARFFALGMTDIGGPLFLSFTLRSDNIRVISSRDMTTRELEVYSDRFKNNAKVQK
jgi:uncharacterized DUF497 family protein